MISEKLLTVAQNQQRVYDKGYADGKAEGGTDSYYDTFWDNFQQNGNRTDYPRAFMGAWWNDENYKPKYPMKPKGSATNMYDNSNISDIGDVDFSECTSFGFQGSAIVTLGVIDARVATSLQQIFSVCRSLVSIEKLWCLPTHGFSNTFYRCEVLTEIRFEPDTIGKNISFAQSSLLSTDSVESIINGLVDLTGQTAQTLTLHSTVKGNLSDTQISAITSKNWTLA